MNTISDMISLCKNSMAEFRALFCFSFFLFLFGGGGAFLFFFKQNLSLSREASLGQTSIFGQNRIYALSRIFDLNRSYALRRILFGHISFWKNIVPELKTWFLFRFFLFRFFLFFSNKTCVWPEKHLLVSRIYALSRIFDLNRNYALRRIYFGHVSFCKKSMTEFRALFCFSFFLFGGGGGGLFFFFFKQGLNREASLGQTSNFGQSRIHALSRILICIGIMLWEEYFSGMFHFGKNIMPEFRAWFLFCFVSVSFFVFSNKSVFGQNSIFGSDKYFWSEQNLCSE